MIKKLKLKFTAIAMLAVLIVFVIIIGAMNISSFASLDDSAEKLIAFIYENGGSVPKFSEDKREPGGMKADPAINITPDTHFQTRFFTVTLKNGAVTSTDTGYIASVTASEASEAALEDFESGRSSGYRDSCKFMSFAQGEETVYIYLDCSRELNSFYDFLWASVLCGVAGIALIFVLVVLFSNAAMRPVLRSYERQKQFITDAGHEIKTPLTIIGANADVIEMIHGESEWTDSIKNQISRLTALTDKLILLVKTEENAQKLAAAEFSLSEAVEQTAQTFAPVAATRNRHMRLEIEPDVRYTGDETAIRRLVSLLLDNAVKYSNDGGSITVSLSQNGKNRILRVSNTVDSIEKGDHGEFFGRFYRSDKSRNAKTGGHGIGLAVAKAVVDAHKGKISAVSKDGKSLEIVIDLRY